MGKSRHLTPSLEVWSSSLTNFVSTEISASGPFGSVLEFPKDPNSNDQPQGKWKKNLNNFKIFFFIWRSVNSFNRGSIQRNSFQDIISNKQNPKLDD